MLGAMSKGRLEAFSDGVIAILITIMVLELHKPEGASLDALAPLVPELLSYLLSFVYVAIYWNNHHHMLHATDRVNGAVLWANLHLLFWLSLFPFATGWMGENHFAPMPTALYGFVLLMAALAYHLLQRLIIVGEGEQAVLKRAVGRDWKGKGSMLCYLAAVVASLRAPQIAQALYVLVALLWLVPDRRVERAVQSR